MRKFQYLLFALEQSYTCYYIICTAVPLNDGCKAAPSNAKMVKKTKKNLMRQNKTRIMQIKKPDYYQGLITESITVSNAEKDRGMSNLLKKWQIGYLQHRNRKLNNNFIKLLGHLNICDASLAYLKSLQKKCAFPAFHKLSFDLFTNNL